MSELGFEGRMSTRPTRRRQRQDAQPSRTRILGAARELLTAEEGFAGLNIDAVARQAGVTRMTIYYQFTSKAGLLEALFDDLAARGRLAERLPAAHQQPDPLDALAELITAFVDFWSSDRLVLRRLRSLAALDPDLEQAVRARDERRREQLRSIVRRLADQRGGPAAEASDETVDILHTLTSFETFDTLAGTTRSPADVAPIVNRLARAALGLHNQ
jgi:AcrR family transcriptional regulator